MNKFSFDLFVLILSFGFLFIIFVFRYFRVSLSFSLSVWVDCAVRAPYTSVRNTHRRGRLGNDTKPARIRTPHRTPYTATYVSTTNTVMINVKLLPWFSRAMPVTIIVWVNVRDARVSLTCTFECEKVKKKSLAHSRNSTTTTTIIRQ